MIQTRTERPAGGTALALGLLLAALMAAMLLAAPKPAHATTLTVTNTNDSGAGSLRRAIDDANANAGADAIEFNIPGNEVKTISPASALPDITDTVAIDGYTQPGTEKNTLAKGTNAVLKIELNGENAGNAAGLEFNPPSGKTTAGSVVRGLSINRFDGPGILLNGGVRTSGLRIEGNFLGTNPGGTEALGNGDGVNYFAAIDSTIGGARPTSATSSPATAEPASVPAISQRAPASRAT